MGYYVSASELSSPIAMQCAVQAKAVATRRIIVAYY